jgi:hypothetical protein
MELPAVANNALDMGTNVSLCRNILLRDVRLVADWSKGAQQDFMRFGIFSVHSYFFLLFNQSNL